MRPVVSLLLLLILLLPPPLRAEPDFPLTEDSKPKPGVHKGELIKASHTAREGSVFPGTEREYTLYLPPSFDKTKPAPFMVFQDGVIYQAPNVFDNLIAKKEIPPLVGVFVKPGVVPAANENALPRFNRSYEYDSVTDTYARFLIDELLPAIEQKHGLKFSTDPNDAAISGNSSGGIAAFMVAWHRHDRFRRVFTGVGTYVGIRGADQLPVLIRKIEPKPIKVFLQSGTGDNNLYCGDWWMANQMMERSLTWAGYDVNHAWGEGGHNQKHASQIFPDVLRWLWKGWPDAKEVKVNPRGESKWRGYEVVGAGDEWEEMRMADRVSHLCGSTDGTMYCLERGGGAGETPILRFKPTGIPVRDLPARGIRAICVGKSGSLYYAFCPNPDEDVTVIEKLDSKGNKEVVCASVKCSATSMVAMFNGTILVRGAGGGGSLFGVTFSIAPGEQPILRLEEPSNQTGEKLVLSPDQSGLYRCDLFSKGTSSYQIRNDGSLGAYQQFGSLEVFGMEPTAAGLCVDSAGRLYVATSLGIQVCDQAGRVNFIIPTPQQPYDVCFGGKDLSELFIACGDKIYKRQTKAHGIVSGQMAPIKPAAPRL